MDRGELERIEGAEEPVEGEGAPAFGAGRSGGRRMARACFGAPAEARAPAPEHAREVLKPQAFECPPRLARL